MSPNIALPLAGLGFCVWAVYLGGLASLQAMCVDNSSVENSLHLAGVLGFSANQPCSRVFSFYWFIMSFEIVALVGLGLCAATNMFYHSYRQSFLALFSVLTVLYIYATNTFLDVEDVDWFSDGTQLHRIRATTAGVLMTAVVNGFIIFALGMDSNTTHNAHHTKEEYRAKDVEMATDAHAPTHATTTTTHVPAVAAPTHV